MNNTGGIKFSLDRTGCSSLSLIQFHSEETNFLCFPCRRSIQLGFYLTGALIHLLGLDPSSCPASTASSPVESPSPPAHSSLKLPVVCGHQAGKGQERKPPRELHLFKQSQVCVVSPREHILGTPKFRFGRHICLLKETEEAGCSQASAGLGAQQALPNLGMQARCRLNRFLLRSAFRAAPWDTMIWHLLAPEKWLQGLGTPSLEGTCDKPRLTTPPPGKAPSYKGSSSSAPCWKNTTGGDLPTLLPALL